MDFKNMSLKSIFPVLLLSLLFIGLLIWRLSPAPPSTGPSEIPLNVGAPQGTAPIAEQVSEPAPGPTKEEDTAIQEQLDRDRRQQKQTKDLKIKLEQTNLELEQEKALAQINKLKKENMEAFNEPAVDGQNNLPEIRIDYIGGNSVKKEAILSIGGTSYQVKEKSMPLANIQVVSISDSSVVLHLSAPQDLIKTIDYKPE